MAPELAPEYANLKVIDADSHITEPRDLWTSRVGAKYQDLVPHVVKDANGNDTWVFNGDVRLAAGGAGSNVRTDGMKVPLNEHDITLGMPYEDIHPASYDPRERAHLLDTLGIYAQVAYANVAGFGAERFMRLSDEALGRLIISTYNDGMADFQRDSNERVFPMALVPFWDINAAVGEAVRAKTELGLRGITMCSEPHSAGMPDLLDKHWDPLWEVCTDLSIPVNFHVGATEFGREAFLKGVWPSHDRIRSIIIGASMLEMHQAQVIANLLMGDLFQRFPKVRWVVVESGIGYIPYVLERLAYQIEDARAIEGGGWLPHPQKQFQDHMYACFWFEDFGPRFELEMLGFDNVLFETDFPHPTCLYPSPVEHGMRVLEKWGPEVVRKVMSENAAKLYEIPI